MHLQFDKMKNVLLFIHHNNLAFDFFFAISKICMIDSYQFSRYSIHTNWIYDKREINSLSSNDQNAVTDFQHECHCEIVNIQCKMGKTIKFICKKKRNNTSDFPRDITNFLLWIYKSFHLSSKSNHLRLLIQHFTLSYESGEWKKSITFTMGDIVAINCNKSVWKFYSWFSFISIINFRKRCDILQCEYSLLAIYCFSEKNKQI